MGKKLLLKQKRPRGIKKDDPRIYDIAKNEVEALAKVEAFCESQDKLNLLLRRAVYWSDLLTAEAALKRGADPNAQNTFGEGAMHSLCANGNVKMFHLLMEFGASLEHDKFGMPPLYRAVQEFREDLLPEMITAGADVNAHDNLVLNTALHYAAQSPTYLGMVKTLLAAGADPREVNCAGENPLEALLSLVKIKDKLGKLYRPPHPATVKVLRAALRKWKGKPLPKKPRRKPKSELERIRIEKFKRKYFGR